MTSASPRLRFKKLARPILVLSLVLSVLSPAVWLTLRIIRAAASPSTLELPTTRVKRGKVILTVAARGELQGGNSEMLTAPMTGGGDMAITYLREPGELVNSGDVVVQFDTTEQDYRLKEAEADFAEAQQQVIKAEADSEATAEESRYAMLSAQADVKQAEIEVRRNPIVAEITARQNVLALEAAKNRERQSTQDFTNKQTTSAAGIAIQKAAENKARVMADIAKKNIDNMTLKAKTEGYVNIQQNTRQNMMYWGMQLPPFQLGDTTNAGMAIAQIPDLKSWEVSAQVGELDRGHLAEGQHVSIRVVALAGKEFPGKVKFIGGTTGMPWDRHFEARIALDQPAPELRPGMTSNMVITVDTLDNVLWIPSQALFESDGRTFVYSRGQTGFAPHDVSLVQRSESQAVVTGINEGELVALSTPDQQTRSAGSIQQDGAMKALQK
ncbi:MAG TPA: efflux RND transporter periplasmic adaptor subunit [Candidatus Acidoferrales bacterium]|nr:efflux RND transporter periplasmic adaptor subunit [Candidatus Acidoferrales bacterium]